MASRILPARIRHDLLALYTFARGVDDLGDEPAAGLDAAARLAALDDLEKEIRGLAAGEQPASPLLLPLAGAVRAGRVPVDPLIRLVEANRRDQLVTEYRTFEQLREYCRLSADPVGELVLHVFGAATPARITRSDRICTALQLIEHLQDIGQDARRGRVYLPRADRLRFGVPVTDLTAPRAGPALRGLVRFEAGRAQALLAAGAPLLGGLGGWARVCVAGYLAGGQAALDALDRAGYDMLGAPTRASRTRVLRHWLRLLVRGAS